MTSPPATVRYYYTSTQPPSRPVYSTSRTEIRDILIAFAVLTFDLTLILAGAGLLDGGAGLPALLTPTVLPIVALAAVAGITGFLAHELAHKFVAQRNRSWAEFRMAPIGLLISVVTAYAGFLFAAPGATVVGGMNDREAWGRTSLAGPLTNLGFAVLFFSAASIGWYWGLSITVLSGLGWLVFINGWFATFNLIPFGPLDGAKVLRWRPVYWVASIVAAGIGTFFGYLAYVNTYLGHPPFLL